MDDNNQRTSTWIWAVIIALLLLGLVYTFTRNTKNKNSLNAEKLNSERLLNEKTTIGNELEKLKLDLAVLKDQSDSNSKLLGETETKLADTERRMRALSSQYNKKSKEDLEEYQKQKEALEKEYASLKSSYDDLMVRNGDLQKKLTESETQAGDLIEKIKMMDTFDSDNFQVYGSRGKNDRVVACARRVKKLNINFEVPQSLADAISFKIITPSGTTITGEDKALSWIFPPEMRTLTASLSPVTAEFEQSKRVTLTYAPKEKLAPGEYKIQIFTNDKNIGNCRIMLK